MKLFSFMLILSVFLSACSLSDMNITSPTPVEDDNIDNQTENEENTNEMIIWDDKIVLEDLDGSEHIDLTTMSSTMVFGQIYNMIMYPYDYKGKMVTMSGEFVVYENLESNVIYTACIIADALACCAQGLEFVLAEELVYPDEYPELNTIITVTGIFDIYDEGEYDYVRLIDATFK